MFKVPIKVLVSMTMVLTISVTLFVGCKNNEEDNGNASTSNNTSTTIDEKKGEFTMVSFTDEPKSMIAEFNKKFPDIKINLTTVPNDQYATKMTTVLNSGADVPDIFTSEVKAMKKWTEAGYMEDLSKTPYNAGEILDKMPKYIQDLSKNKDGQIIGLSWQATPGGVFYKRELAKKYFGTDDPEQVHEKVFKDFDTVYKAAKTIKEQSGGKAYLFPDAGTLRYFYQANIPWIEDGKLYVGDSMNKYIDEYKKWRGEGLDGRMGEWSPAWTAAMKDSNVFCHALPTWGEYYLIKKNAGDEFKGKYGVTAGPNAYWWGGTWAHIYNKSTKKNLAYNFIKFITSDEDYLKYRANADGDFVSYKPLVEKLANDPSYKDEYLGGQNTYKFYSSIVETIDASSVTKYDDEINARFNEALSSYLNGKKKRDEVIPSFKKDIKTQYGGDIVVD